MSKNNQYWYWNDVTNIDQNKEIVKFIDDNFDDFEPENWGAKDEKGSKKKSSIVKWIYYGKIKNYLEPILDLAIQSNYENFGYDLYNMTNGRRILLNTYSSEFKSKYDWHIDTSSGEQFVDTKLTILLNVSTENYTGGEFEIFNNNIVSVPELSKPGNMIMFRSYLHHRVLPVKTGERKTLAIFLLGPKLR